MYDFLLSEAWWVDVIIAALITGVVSCIGFICLYNYKIKKLLDDLAALKAEQKALVTRMSDDKKDLSGEHKDLSGEHHRLSREHSNLSNTLSSISANGAAISDKLVAGVAKIDKISDIVVEEKAKQELRFSNLNMTQQGISEKLQLSASIFTAAQNELLSIKQENLGLLSERNTARDLAEKLERDLASIAGELRVAQQQLNVQQKANYNLSQANAKLQEQYNQLKEEQDDKPRQTNRFSYDADI